MQWMECLYNFQSLLIYRQDLWPGFRCHSGCLSEARSSQQSCLWWTFNPPSPSSLLPPSDLPPPYISSSTDIIIVITTIVFHSLTGALWYELMVTITTPLTSPETATKTGMIIVLGEITTTASLDYQTIVRETVKNIGYDDSNKGVCVCVCVSYLQSSSVAWLYIYKNRTCIYLCLENLYYGTLHQ